jgi:NitT/TauT family transport system substrate-binding protein
MQKSLGRLLGLVAITAALLCGTAFAQEQIIKVAVLKVASNAHYLHYAKFSPPGYKFQAVLVNTPGDAKDAVVSGAADFGLAGVAAAILGNANGEPIVIVSNLVGGSMAVIAKADSPIKTVADLKGKKVGIQPGSTQELVIIERLKQLGMTTKDIQPVRVGLGEMHAALGRGDIDAYVGTEPGATLSITENVGRLVEYPYGTPTGDLLTAVMANAKFVKDNPKATQDFVLTHARATEFLKANPEAWTEDASKTFGVKPELFKLALKNFNAEWKMSPVFVKQIGAFAQQMLENKLIRQPVTDGLVITTFTDQVVKTGL